MKENLVLFWFSNYKYYNHGGQNDIHNSRIVSQTFARFSTGPSPQNQSHPIVHRIEIQWVESPFLRRDENYKISHGSFLSQFSLINQKRWIRIAEMLLEDVTAVYFLVDFDFLIHGNK